MPGDLELRLKYKKGDDDDWTKVEDKAVRKKLQNRLAKRKSRVDAKKSKALSGPPPPPPSPPPTHPESSIAPPPTDSVIELPPHHTKRPSRKRAEYCALISSLSAPETFSTDALIFNTPDPPAVASISNDDPAVASSKAAPGSRSASFSAALMQAYVVLPGLTEHHHLPLPQYTMLRAYVANAQLLSFDLITFADDMALSPFCSTNYEGEVVTPPSSLALASLAGQWLPPARGRFPHTLAPTALQKSTPHHPYIDVIAPPSLRDGILLAQLTDEQEEELCIGMHHDSFVVWGGQPWNAFAWEVSQSFIDSWGWLIDKDVIRSSNFWRAERGEEELQLPDWHVLSLG